MKILLGLISLVILIGISFLISEDKKKIKWKTVMFGLAGQLILVFFVLKIPFGQKVLSAIATGFDQVFQMGMEGLTFVFGPLITDNFIFATSVLGMIVFTSTLIAVLYFFKIIPFLVKYVGGAIAKLLGVSNVEAMICVSNSLLGGSEAPLVVKNYLPTISRSELFVVMASGFSSASVGILAGYQQMGFPLEYMLIAVFTVPFSCLMISKILIPAEDVMEDKKEVELSGEEYSNIFEAISKGAITGMQVALSVGAVLIGFLGIIAILNAILGMVGLSLSEILGWIFMPFGWLLGIPQGEIVAFSQCLGFKVGVNEFAAFDTLAQFVKSGAVSPRTVNILTTALTNFANFSVIGIVGASLITLAPTREKEILGFGVKALMVGVISTMITTTLVALMI